MGTAERGLCPGGNAGSDGDFVGCHFAVADSPRYLSRPRAGGWSSIDRVSLFSEPGVSEPVRASEEAGPNGLNKRMIPLNLVNPLR